MGKKGRKWHLIDNFNHVTEVFHTLQELKEYAKEKGFKPKKSPMSIRCYWLDNAF